jgi:hypothetical protein
MTTLRTEQDVRKLKQEVKEILKEVSLLTLHWNTATADRNIPNYLKAFCKGVFNFPKVMRKIAIKFDRNSKEERLT